MGEPVSQTPPSESGGGFKRGMWSSRTGFILAAAGSAIGLGNIWKFPYIAGVNGGGAFVLIYLVAIVLVGYPIMLAELVIGRNTQASPVVAFGKLAGPESKWKMLGWLGVLTGFIILSYYSVVAGWALNYVLMSVCDFLSNKSPEQISSLFDKLYVAGDINLFWHTLFMLLTIGIVFGGVKKGIERWARILMPMLFLIMLILVARVVFLPGFVRGVSFVFAPNFDKLTAAGVLEAVGHAFFTLSLGMGAMLTYGSYLSKKTDLVKASAVVCSLDLIIALMSCLIIFPIVFSFGFEPDQGPGLVFKTIPVVLSQIAGGELLAILFFLLLAFAALTSSISLLEVVTSHFIDSFGWSRKKATLIPGLLILLFGIPSALAGGGGLFSSWESIVGKNFFDTVDYLATNWMLPLGGILIAIFIGWFAPLERIKDEFQTGSKFKHIFIVWLWAIRVIVPIVMVVVLLYKVRILDL
ncbi:MAG: sodium-dependent transporter [Deltaproteobacteria bacterium]|nr:sodium-dependent transporter [Deltaproteobacteria bacterium]